MIDRRATGVMVMVTMIAGCVISAPVGPSVAPISGSLEYQVDRPGSDYRSFDLPEPRPDLCLAACTNEWQCLAFTYVQPGVQGPSPRCWLKSAIPDATPNPCCISGVVRTTGATPAPTTPPPGTPPPPPPPSIPPPPGASQPGGQGGGLELSTDRPGSDYRSFDLPQPVPEICQSACFAEAPCVAFTYVRPGVQGPSARCWLKSGVPQPSPNDCCVSGVKPR
jgi:hypothetical protein